MLAVDLAVEPGDSSGLAVFIEGCGRERVDGNHRVRAVIKGIGLHEASCRRTRDNFTKVGTDHGSVGVNFRAIEDIIVIAVGIVGVGACGVFVGIRK